MDNKRHLFRIEDGHIEMDGISPSCSMEETLKRLLEKGFVRTDDTMRGVISYKGILSNLGTCFVRLHGKDERIWLIDISTERAYDEDEAFTILGQIEEDLESKSRYDDGGYGTPIEPHIIRHFWDLDQGYVEMFWDTKNSRYGDDRNRIHFWFRPPTVKDEAYWRSEVD